MKISALRIDTFAGINDKNVIFDDGLTVLAGPNEAGKSTVVQALYASLFRDTQMGRGTREYKDFSRFMPHPDGKSIRTALTIHHDGHEYILKKEWGSHPSTELLVDGQLIRDPKKISVLMKQLLKFGEGTYEKIVFAKQTEFQTILEKVAADPETAGTLSGVLRQAVMELDGLSVDALKNRIEAEYNRLADHWDEDFQRPEGNRGIHHPWKTKVGEVLERYYRVEALKLDLEEVQNLENQFAQAAERLKESAARRDVVGSEISRLSRMESDMAKRRGLETQMASWQKEYDALKVINSDYPVLKSRLDEDKEKGRKLKEERAALDEEMKLSRQLDGFRADVEIMKRVEDLDERLKTLMEARDSLADFTDDVVARLDTMDRLQREAEVAMAAARLQGMYRTGNEPLVVSHDMNESEMVDVGQSFEADGYLKLLVGDDVEIEITSGTIDYPSLKKQRVDAHQNMVCLLQELAADSIEEAKENHQKLLEALRQIVNLQRQQKELLGDRDRSELAEKVKKLAEVQVRPMDELDPLKEEMGNRINDLKISVLQAEDRIMGWQKEYGDLTQVIDQMVDRQVKLRGVSQEMAQLPMLPEEFSDVDAFRTTLDNLRQEAVSLDQIMDALRSDYYQVKSELANKESLEELAQLLKEAQASFQQSRTRLQNVFRVRQAFYQTLDAMDQNTFEPLIRSFGDYLNQLTEGRYRTGRIDESLEIDIVRADGIEVPSNLLSMGTYDSVALAFRLAVLDHLFSDSSGLLVLDDCLVNMDEKRKEQALALIRACAKKHQVIFSTCSEDTADRLAGKRIHING